MTGAAGGIGTAVTLLFAGKGWRVYAVDKDGDNLRRLYSSQPHIRVLSADLTDLSVYDSVVGDIESDAEGQVEVDALVNCAGVILPQPSVGR